MESQNITIDPQTDFKEGKAETLSVPLENTLQRSSRIKKIQTTAMILLFLAAVLPRPKFIVRGELNDSPGVRAQRH